MRQQLYELVKSFDNLPKIVKLILAIPALDIMWNVYRILKSVTENNTLGIIVGVLLLIVGFPFMWVIDMICIVLNNTVWWF